MIIDLKALSERVINLLRSKEPIDFNEFVDGPKDVIIEDFKEQIAKQKVIVSAQIPMVSKAQKPTRQDA
jgi:hypothetical protein